MTLYTLGFKTAEQGRLGYNEGPRPVRTTRCAELHKTTVCYEYGYAQADTYYRYRSLPTRRLKRITIPIA